MYLHVYPLRALSLKVIFVFCQFYTYFQKHQKALQEINSFLQTACFLPSDLMACNFPVYANLMVSSAENLNLSAYQLTFPALWDLPSNKLQVYSTHLVTGIALLKHFNSNWDFHVVLVSRHPETLEKKQKYSATYNSTQLTRIYCISTFSLRYR